MATSPNSCVNVPKIKQQGFSQNCTSDSIQTTITWQSREPVLTGKIWTPQHNGEWKCGQNYTYGRLDSINLQQADGPFWNATLTYTQPLSTNIIVTTDSNDNKDATSNYLNIRMLSLPLEKNPNYVYTWNHMLIGLSGYSQTETIWQQVSGTLSSISRNEAINLYNEHSDCIRWIRDISQLPTEPQKKTTETPSETPGEDPIVTVENYKWYIMYDMKKPGVEYYQIPTYEITESTKHKSRNNAAWCAAQRSGRLRFPTFGDFGLTKHYHSDQAVPNPSCYYWLCQGGGISYDGKYWIAQCTYIWSPDPYGWDQQLYDVSELGYGDDFTKNSIFNFN